MGDKEQDGKSNALLAHSYHKLALKYYLGLANQQSNVFFAPSALLTDSTLTSNNNVACCKHCTLCSKLPDISPYLNFVCAVIEVQGLVTVHRSVISSCSDFELQHRETCLKLKNVTCPMSESHMEDVNKFMKSSNLTEYSRLLELLNADNSVDILNAVYFKGYWKYKFNSIYTQLRIFYNDGKQSEVKEIPMMLLERWLFFVQTPLFKAVELPYANSSISMIIVLPHEINGFEEITKAIGPDFFRDVWKSMSRTVKVELFLPKICIDFTKEFHMCKESNSSNANSNENFVNSSCPSIFHRAVLDIGEEGEQADTLIATLKIASNLELTQKVHCNHPFLFFIYDKKIDLIHFVGHVKNL